MGDLGAGYGRFFHLLFHFQVRTPKIVVLARSLSMHRILRLVLRLLAVSVVFFSTSGIGVRRHWVQRSHLTSDEFAGGAKSQKNSSLFFVMDENHCDRYLFRPDAEINLVGCKLTVLVQTFEQSSYAIRD
jgi:hypothetical protein